MHNELFNKNKNRITKNPIGIEYYKTSHYFNIKDR